jgi:Holliday junction resolvase RusA-like endonuclease
MTTKKELKKYRQNLRTWFNRASAEEFSEGMAWYREAMEYSKELSKKFNVSGEVAAGVISALSPNNKWKRNKIDAFNVLKAIRDGVTMDEVKVCTYNANKAKAFAIGKGNREILTSSPKTYAFARNVGENDVNFVTIDKWHLRACQTASKTSKECKETVTPKQYRIIQEETVKVANEMGVIPYEFQAIVWVTIRNQWN